jgi:hypothetical protein
VYLQVSFRSVNETVALLFLLSDLNAKAQEPVEVEVANISCDLLFVFFIALI